MIISETLLVKGQPVGRLILDTNSQEVAFQPNVSLSPLPNRHWSSVDKLRAAVVKAYQDKGGSDG